MKLFFSVIMIVGISFFVSCVEKGEDSIYGDINDSTAEEPDSEDPDYQTQPDSNDIEINDNQNDETISDIDEVIPDEETDITKGMILIPQGKAWVGCNENIETACPANELPYHEISTKAYFIDKYEVTAAEFQKCINNEACGEEDVDYYSKTENEYCNLGTSRTDHPMNCVNWKGADLYCKWVGKKLPAEGEWEKAARGGCEIYDEEDCEAGSFIYTWGNDGEADCSKVNMAISGSDWGCNNESTAVGGSYPASDSPYGVSDMLGNVAEWVEDDWSENHGGAKPDGSATILGNGQKVFKGASFIIVNPLEFKISFRKSLSLNNDSAELSKGFRCIADVPE